MNEIIEKIKNIERKLQSEDKQGKKLCSKIKAVYGTDKFMHELGYLRQSDLEESIHNMTQALQSLDKKIADSNAQAKLEKKQRYTDKLQQEKRMTEELNKTIKNLINPLIVDGPRIMCKSSLESATELIAGEMRKGNLPNASKRMLVSELLTRNSCLCGSSLDHGTDARKRIEREEERLTGDERFDIASEIKQKNEEFLNGYEYMLKRLDEEIKTIENTKTELNRIREDLRYLELSLSPDNDAYTEWISQRDQLRRQRDEEQVELGRVLNEIEGWKSEKGNLARSLDVAKMKERKHKEAVLLKQKSEDFEIELGKIKKYLDQAIRHQVADKTLMVYNKMSWKKNFSHLGINNRYQISITSDDGTNIAGGLAAGEKLFLALSFIMALKKITNYRFPFIIDSPLGKTGNNLRRRFGTHMPELLDGSQMIMLATDTEWNNDKIPNEDGGKATHTLKELLEQKGEVHEYAIDFDKEDETANIIRSKI